MERGFRSSCVSPCRSQLSRFKTESEGLLCAHQVDSSVGQVSEVAMMLAVAATETEALSAIIDPTLEDPGLLLHAVVAASDPELVAIYNYINRSVSDYETKLNFLTELFPPMESDTVEPKGFYQVAVDLPLYGKHGERLQYGSANSMHRAAVKDIIKCLGKTNAFAVVAVDKGAEMLFGSLVEDPRLTSFAVVRDPDFNAQTADTLQDLFQPVLLLSDSEDTDKKAQTKMLRELGVACPAFTLTEKPQYFDVEAGRDMLVLFNAHQWKGALGLGLSKKLPQRTRVVGGVSAWEGPNEAPDLEPDASPNQLRHLFGGLGSESFRDWCERWAEQASFRALSTSENATVRTEEDRPAGVGAASQGVDSGHG